MASEQVVGVPVELYVYDLTHGLASVLSPAIIGQQVEGVWHTALVVYEREYFYGGHGITCCTPGSTQLGRPQQVERLGETFVPFAVFTDYIEGLATSTYAPAEYRLLEHNCNHFTDEVAQFLCGARVPKHIVAQPALLPPPLRLALQSLLDSLTPQQARGGGVVRLCRRDSPDFLTLNQQVEEARSAAAAARAGAARRVERGVQAGAGARGRGLAHAAAQLALLVRGALVALLQSAQSAALGARRSSLAEKLARKERRKEKKRRKHARAAGAAGDRPAHSDDECSMAEATEVAARAGPSAAPAETDADAPDAREAAEQRRRALDPPILFTDIDAAAEYDKLLKEVQPLQLTPEEQQSLDELQQYLVQGEGSWVLGDEFLAFVERLLAEDTAVREALLRCLAACALREDVSLVLHQDRRRHALMSHAARIDALPLNEQLALALFMCNLFAHAGAAEWLLYISEWAGAGGAPLSNIRATTKVCVHALLSEAPALRDAGSALMHNVATREVKTVRLAATRPLRDLLPRAAKAKVFDEVCAELGMAVLQLLTSPLPEEQLFRALKSLARLCAGSADVPQLVALVGPAPSAFRGASARVDEQIDLVMQRVRV